MPDVSASDGPVCGGKPGVFITGTDTSVGKTFVGMALARRALANGHRVFAFKPIETGCTTREGELVGEDQEALALSAGNWQSGPLRGVYRFRLPAAPSVAAAVVDQVIDYAPIERACREGARDASYVIVEGAGGWRVPITEESDMATLAGRIGLPILIVARASLGTLNHTLLTVEAVARDGLPLAAIVLSKRPEDPVELTLSNVEQLQRRISAPVILLAEDDRVLDALILSVNRPS